MDSISRIIVGYHGCDPAFAGALIDGSLSVSEWKPSRNPYDWLGEGIYFWEHAPGRAMTWGGKGGVVGALIQLGLCLDLTEIRYTDLLATHYQSVRETYERKGLTLPRNRGKRRDLDCLVINELFDSDGKNRFQTVRCPFLEGDPIFPGSGIRRESHIQVAVRDPACILGVFRPNLA